MSDCVFVLLLALFFVSVMFFQKIKTYFLSGFGFLVGVDERDRAGKIGTADSAVSLRSVEHKMSRDDYPSVVAFTSIDDCMKSVDDCDVTYKTVRVRPVPSFLTTIGCRLASNDSSSQKNRDTYNPTCMQDDSDDPDDLA